MKILNKKNISFRLLIIISLIFLALTGCQQPAEEEDEGITQGDASWHEVGAAGEPVLQTAHWNNAAGYATCAFRKDGFGIVHLKGRLNGTVGYVIFYLPPGYMPGRMIYIGDSAGYVSISANGAVTSSISPAFLDGISFYAN